MNQAVGLDIGSSYTKAVLVDRGGAIRSESVLRTGADFERASRRAFARCLKGAPSAARNGSEPAALATGVGRGACRVADRAATELSCLARGSWSLLPRPHVLVDIGGQDNKVVHVESGGRLAGFKMNRKCAAGTGAFLEEIARRLDIPIRRMNALAEGAAGAVEIGSYCTVFTCTEIIHHIREGRRAPEILRGCYESVARRILEMDPLRGDVALTGGVFAHHPVVAGIFRDLLGREPFVPPSPHLVGALGAALIALERGTAARAVESTPGRPPGAPPAENDRADGPRP